MLVQFTVKNFKTFKETATLSFVASNYDKETLEHDNVFKEPDFGLRLLKSNVIYGANASGKSKLLEALKFMKVFVLTSSKDRQKGEAIPVTPFKLNVMTAEAPSEFEIIFIHHQKRYRYGFELDKNQIITEWLYVKSNKKEVELFFRDAQDIELHKRNFKNGRHLIEAGFVRENALFLSVAAQFNQEIAVAVLEGFQNMHFISGLENRYKSFTISKLEDDCFKAKILELLKAADLGIEDFKTESVNLDKLPDDMPKDLKKLIKGRVEKDSETTFVSDVLAFRKQYEGDEVMGRIPLSLNREESKGTEKFFALAGPIIDTLENGYVLAVDELDVKLHPNLVAKIISLFHSEKHNPKNAQLLFNTHNTNLLNEDLFRRDQVWFTEKDRKGAATLYSLTDIKKTRKHERFEANYIMGKYGGVPYLGFFDDFN